MKISYYFALWAGKCAALALKLTHHRGTDFPGNCALKICPDFAKYIAKPKTIIGITGTNGKTTTTNIIADLLEADGQVILTNREGANCISGVLTSLINGVTMTGRSRYDLAVFEIDERSSKTILPYVHPDYLVVTNLTRDSIMRNAHPEYISWVISRFMPEKTRLIINGDDLIAVNLAVDNPRCTFGLDVMETDRADSKRLTNDMQICPKCHGKLVYDVVRYLHIGRAHCPECGYRSPDNDFLGCDVDLEGGTLKIEHENETAVFPLLTNGIHDVYNVTAAAAALYQIGYSLARTAELMKQITIVASRYSVAEPKPGYRVIRQMSKDINAAATSRAFEHIAGQPGKKELILMIFCRGDDTTWSENVCWMFDSDFEFLNHPDIVNIICTGPRWADFRLRLEMAGVPKDRIKVVPNIARVLEAPDHLTLEGPEDVYILYGTDYIELSEALAQGACDAIRDRGPDAE